MGEDIFKKLFEEKRRQEEAKGIQDKCEDCGGEADQTDNWTGERVCANCARNKPFARLRGLRDD